MPDMPAVGGRGFRIDFDEHALTELLHGEHGPVAAMLDTKAAVMVQGAKRRAPVSPHGSHGRPSGWLRSSIGHEVGLDAEGLYVDVGAGADYAIFQELGTSRAQAQPFLRPALDDWPG